MLHPLAADIDGQGREVLAADDKVRILADFDGADQAVTADLTRGADRRGKDGLFLRDSGKRTYKGNGVEYVTWASNGDYLPGRWIDQYGPDGNKIKEQSTCRS